MIQVNYICLWGLADPSTVKADLAELGLEIGPPCSVSPEQFQFLASRYDVAVFHNRVEVKNPRRTTHEPFLCIDKLGNRFRTMG